MKKKFKVERLIWLVVAILSIIYALGHVFCREQCYSEEYGIYCKIKDMTNVDDVRSQLKELKLEYTLEDNRLTLKEFDNISFDVLDDKSCLIASNNVMQNFEILDGDSIKNITIDGTLEKEKIKETVSLVDDGSTYIKRNGDYFVKSPFMFQVVFLLVVIAILASVLIFVDIFDKKPKRTTKSGS